MTHPALETGELNRSVAAPPIPAPEPIFNCPQCSHWLAPGSLACPECHAIVYSGHLRRLAVQATSEENGGRWAEARDTWTRALEWLPPQTTQQDTVLGKIAQLNDRMRGVADRKAAWTRRLGPLAPVLLFLSKAKFLFTLFKLKFLLSFAAFFGLYWALFGWRFGLGFAVSILIHEMGHYVAARRLGLKVDLPVFLPGMGAYVRWYAQGISLDTLASIALAGPFFGLLAAVGFAAAAATTGQPVFAALAHTGAWINLVNLTPVFGLDGAKAALGLSRTQRALIGTTALAFFAVSQEAVFWFIILGMGLTLFRPDAETRANPLSIRQSAEPPPEPESLTAADRSTATMLRFMLLLFALGVVIYVFPDTGRRF